MKKCFLFVVFLLSVTFCFADIEAWKTLVPGRRYSMDEVKLVLSGMKDYSVKGGKIRVIGAELVPLSLKNEIEDYKVPKVHSDTVRTLFICQTSRASDVICLDVPESQNEVAYDSVSMMVYGEDSHGIPTFAFSDKNKVKWYTYAIPDLDLGYWDVVHDSGYFYNKTTRKLYKVLYADFERTIVEFQLELTNPIVSRYKNEYDFVNDYDEDGKEFIKSYNIPDLDIKSFVTDYFEN